MIVKKLNPSFHSNMLNRIALAIITLMIMNILSCSSPGPEPEIKELTDEDALAESVRVQSMYTIDTAEGLKVDLWASEYFLGDPVALSMDHQGRAWVSVTNRSNNSEFDIRGYRHWMTPSASFRSVEDRRNFLHDELAPEKSEQNTWLPDRNQDGSHDWRDLAVLKEEVYVLEDLTGNNLANRSSLFLRDFNTEVTDVLGALYYDNQRDEVFIGVAPDAWRAKDTNQDGMADDIESLSHGYGVHIGFSGHGMSGMTKGPDGRIYYAIGDMGLNVTDNTGKNWYHPNEGAIIRMEPDGSNYEIFATGLRNTHEFDFDKYGNLISVDNDGDHAGEYERLVYLTDGSDSGWRFNWQFGKYSDPKNNEYKVLMDERYYSTRFEGQAAHVLPPLAAHHSGPTGMVYNPGTALNEQWKDHFFVVQFVGNTSSSGINAFTLEPKGASFTMATDIPVMRGIQATGLDAGPDGALYFTDWIEGWGRNEQGRLWRMFSDNGQSAIQIETQNLLAEDFSQRLNSDLLELLGHEDMRVRSKTQFELAERGDYETLLAAVSESDLQPARIHGMWGIGQISRREVHYADVLIPLLQDEDFEIRAQAAKLLGDVRYEPATESLIPLLQDEYERVQYFATEALGRIGDKAGFLPIINMLEANNDEDVYLRHGGIIALERIGFVDGLKELSIHPSYAVRLAAVVALGRLQDPAVALFLQDENEYIATDAARAINDETQIEAAIPQLAAMLDQSHFTGEPLMRRAINAAIYSGTADDAARLAKFANRMDVNGILRAEAINALGLWHSSSVFDRVSGWYRGEVNNNLEDAFLALQPVYENLLTDDNARVREAMVRSAGYLNFAESIDVLYALLKSDPEKEVRIASLESLQKLGFEEIGDAVLSALNDSDRDVRMAALAMSPELDLPTEEIVEMHALILDQGSVRDQQSAFESLGNIDDAATTRFLESQLVRLINGEIRPEIQLDLILAAENLNHPELNRLLNQYQEMKDPNDRLQLFAESVYGGNAANGGGLFFFNNAAQCIRCHVVGENGSHVGPELTFAGDELTREQLLQSLVDPDARIAPGYGNVTLQLSDGSTVQGRLDAETESVIVLTNSELGQQEYAKSDITHKRYSPSGMPDMSLVLSRSEIRDIVEYLTTLRAE